MAFTWFFLVQSVFENASEIFNTIIRLCFPKNFLVKSDWRICLVTHFEVYCTLVRQCESWTQLFLVTWYIYMCCPVSPLVAKAANLPLMFTGVTILPGIVFLVCKHAQDFTGDRRQGPKSNNKAKLVSTQNIKWVPAERNNQYSRLWFFTSYWKIEKF